MPLIEGIGDEVTHFFIALLVMLVVSLAWWTTSISEQRHVQTVWLLDRRRHRAPRRLTNHTHAVTIAEGTTVRTETVTETPKPPEPGSSSDDRSRIVEAMDEGAPERPKGTDITIKLKYINDDLKLVDGKLQEQLGDFKKRHFHVELASNKLVRLIFNGQVLQQDTKTLEGCGLFDNCVVHCLIHQRRPAPGEESQESRPEQSQNPRPNPNNNNNQGRDWDLGNFLFAIISFTLLSAWYFRYVYAHLYTVTATVGLILMTGVFTIVLFGFYFPDHEHIPQRGDTTQT
ncbi:transmembrane and ubiquitin-like domain-containing protein 1 [Tribolium madens]|uniref:transmembrane and ubiquitin-like domain-containing protein 1 n=1 Tax=Tribolium madens TaxID=41895 RepID=UPI001CF75AD3|nr:transmembrane and ubiquitin-like domain-containing protein 1 [Tribolium madens]